MGGPPEVREVPDRERFKGRAGEEPPAVSPPGGRAPARTPREGVPSRRWEQERACPAASPGRRGAATEWPGMGRNAPTGETVLRLPSPRPPFYLPAACFSVGAIGSQHGLVPVRVFPRSSSPLAVPEPRSVSFVSSTLSQILPLLPEVLAGPVVVADREGCIVHLNPAAEALCGVSAETACGGPVVDLLIPPEDRAHFLSVFEEVLSGHRTEPVEVALRGTDGVRRPVVWHYSRLLNAAGVVEGVLATGTDLTQLRSTEAREELLRESEARFAGIVELASDAIISVDGTHRIVLFNQGAENIFGFAAEEVLGQPLDLLLPPAARAVHRAHMEGFASASVAARPMGERRAIQGRRKNGEEFPAEASILKVKTGGELRFTVLLRDVSEQVRRESRQKFLSRVGAAMAQNLELEDTLACMGNMAVEEVADLCVVDLFHEEEEDRVVRTLVCHRAPEAAAAAERFRTLPLDRDAPHLTREVLGGAPATWVPTATPGRLDAVAQSEEHRALLESLHLQSWIVAPLVARGRLLGALLCARCRPTDSANVPSGSRSGAYDAEDVELVLELGRRAGVAIDNARLYRDARRALEARDEVLGIVSHDLGNPLQAIFIGLEALERSRSSRTEGRPGQEEYYLTAIRRSVEVMERLIRDLLEIRRMEAGHLHLDPQPRRLEALVAEALEILLPLAGVKNIRIENQVLGENLPPVPADGDRIQQVLSNLVGNAVKHTPEGGTVRLSAEVLDTHLLVRVEDTGPGIAPEDLDRVFDRFWRAGQRKERGIGLGLAIARGIVRGHGGRIWVESEVGVGSTFCFTLPLGGH